MTISCPHPVGEVVLSLLVTLDDKLGELILTGSENPEVLELMESSVAVYIFAIERVLGLKVHSLQLIDNQTLREWVAAAVQDPPTAEQINQVFT